MTDDKISRVPEKRYEDTLAEAREYFLEGNLEEATRVLREAGFDPDYINRAMSLWSDIRQWTSKIPVEVSLNSLFLIETFGEKQVKKICRELKIDWKNVSQFRFPLVWGELERVAGIHYGKKKQTE